LYPKLWAVDSFTFTFNASQTTYALPDDLEQILFVSWQTTGSSKEWLPVNRWRADGMANIATFNSTNTINIYENIQPGRTVQVYYTTTPDTLENNSDDFADVTGLPESSQDVVLQELAQITLVISTLCTNKDLTRKHLNCKINSQFVYTILSKERNDPQVLVYQR